MRRIAAVLALGSTVLASPLIRSQVYSPKVVLDGQVDTTDLKTLAATLYKNANARTDREKAEAIWRYLLTDGRFVKPGVFYHIPGWSYEEPMGEVLDPVKLLNSYGFGLCYQDGPLLQALWDAGGFAHTRVWFLTGHTVAEVFYEGKYHYYDSDMMGYTTIGPQSYKTAPVAGVYDLQQDPQIMLSKLEKPRMVKTGAVDYPWYTADVGANAIKDLSDLFSTSADNYVYAYRRYPQGHTMDFVLRPGERMVRYYQNPNKNLRYMPYAEHDGTVKEFPKDVGSILTVANGPRSEKDSRLWSTGLLEYVPPVSAIHAATHGSKQASFRMSSPYVIIGATFHGTSAAGGEITVETSIDDGLTWMKATAPTVNQDGTWSASPLAVATTEHGTKNAVAGTYGYLVRFTSVNDLDLKGLKMTTVFEFNPRTLPHLEPGKNHLTYAHADIARREVPVHANNVEGFAVAIKNAKYISEEGQGYWQNEGDQLGEIVLPVAADGNTPLSGLSVGGRFLDLRLGLAPDKLTAEVRKVAAWPSDASSPSSANIAWSHTPKGPWTTVWSYDPKVKWDDGQEIPQMLRWPEVDRNVYGLPAGTGKLYVKYSFQNLALDDIRLATMQTPSGESEVEITHLWLQDGVPNKQTFTGRGDVTKGYDVAIPPNAKVENTALILSSK
jgi:hypothetical protein